MEHIELEDASSAGKHFPLRWAFYSTVVLKKALEDRGLPTYGSRKAISQRLCDYDAERK